VELAPSTYPRRRLTRGLHRRVTLNQYLGGDLGSLIAPPGGDFNAALLTLLEQIAFKPDASLCTSLPRKVQQRRVLIASAPICDP
jgi:hypothetical protein